MGGGQKQGDEEEERDFCICANFVISTYFKINHNTIVKGLLV